MSTKIFNGLKLHKDINLFPSLLRTSHSLPMTLSKNDS